jgi:hypothetical protein
LVLFSTTKYVFVCLQAKAYTTRVGAGPYPTELFGDQGEELRKAGFEWGTTTGRPRRCGWLDIVALNYACIINGFTALNLTKLDVLSGLSEVSLGVGYKMPNGQKLRSFPADLSVLEQVEVRFGGSILSFYACLYCGLGVLQIFLIKQLSSYISVSTFQAATKSLGPPYPNGQGL